MLDLLKRLIAGRELAALNRYRYACHLVHRWMGNHLAAAESAEWIRQVGEDERGADISQFRGRVENALAMRAPEPLSPPSAPVGVEAFVRDFLAAYSEHEDCEWSPAWRELAERAHALTTPAIAPRAEGSREDRMVVIERDAAGTPTVWCDPEIADLVAALNKAGIRTVASCSGHGHRPGSIALKDGRWLTISPDDETYRRIEALFPVDINGERHGA